VTHLPEHTTVLKIKSLPLLFEMTSFEENVPNFSFLAMRCVLVKTQLSSVFRQTTQNNGECKHVQLEKITIVVSGIMLAIPKVDAGVVASEGGLRGWLYGERRGSGDGLSSVI
jgi:hypothetical protein